MSSFLAWVFIAGPLWSLVLFFTPKNLIKGSSALTALGLLALSFVFATTEKAPRSIELFATPAESFTSLFSGTLLLDGLSLSFATIICFIGAFIFLYSGGYFKKAPEQFPRCAGLLQLFLISMLGVVLSGNLLLLFVFWELTTLTSFLLIGFHYEQADSRRSALISLLVTGAGAACLLAGLILLGNYSQTLNLVDLWGTQDLLPSHPYLTPMLVLILLGAFTKSAQFPFHFWLPRAMTAPTPVSSFLHSATMVKAGVFLVARLSPLFHSFAVWQQSLLIFGAITALWAIVLSLKARDLKEILAYTTVSALGLMIFLLGVGTPKALSACLTFLFVHAFYKAGLFMSTGVIEKTYGTRDLRQLGGAMKAIPVAGFAVLFLALSMAGLPPFLGFISKEVIYAASVKLLDSSIWPLAIALGVNALTAGVGLIFFWHIFMGKAVSQARGQAPRWMLAGPVALALLSLAAGLAPGALSSHFIAPGIHAILPGGQAPALKLWHGLNLELALSLVTAALAIVCLLARRKIWRGLEAGFKLLFFEWFSLFSRFAQAVMGLAKEQTQLFFPGRHQKSFTVFLAPLAVAVVAAFFFLPQAFHDSLTLRSPSAPVILLCGAIGTPPILALFFFSRMSAILIAGISGLSLSLTFAFFSAPDLAITQILIETLLLILFVFVLHRLPYVKRTLNAPGQWVAGAIAACLSLGLGGLLFYAMGPRPFTSVAQSMGEASYLEAHGRNVVNVILVDFRSFDTLGEIAVLCVASVGLMVLVGRALSRIRSS